MFNRHPAVEVLPIAGGQACYVIDDALREPDRWVELAAQHADAFEALPGNAYPGPELRMPDGISAALDAFFARHVRERIGAGGTLSVYSRLSMVTVPPERLQPRQWLCHRDRLSTVPGERAIASVLYLFRDAMLGGTRFYLPTRPAAQIDVLVHESGALTREAFAAKYGLAAGYMTGSNAYFQCALTVEPRWNRLIFYDGGLFHCSDIRVPERLSADPRVGRLTFNGFFTCRSE